MTDQKALLASMHPFDLLSQEQLEALLHAMDIAFYPKGTLLIAPEQLPQVFFIIIKGTVEESLDETLHNVYTEGECFDAHALIYGSTQSTFTVAQELICYELPKAAFMRLLEQHASIGHFFMQDFAAKHALLKAHYTTQAFTPLLLAKVGDIYLHDACIIDSTTSIEEALKAMQNASTIIVRQASTWGIVTDTDLRKRVLVPQKSLDDPIGSVASWGLFTVNRSDFLFEALLLFTRHAVKRLAVFEAGHVVGILEQLDLLSFFANHSHLIVSAIERAPSIEALADIKTELLQLVRLLHSKGVQVRHIAKLTTLLHDKLHQKVLQLILPKPLLAECALVVLGSLGRGEQILYGDQDNALILSDKAAIEAFKPYLKPFNEALSTLGFTLCHGGVMVQNPLWCRTQRAFEVQLFGWKQHPTAEALMQLSIFLDGRVVAGNEALLEPLKHRALTLFSQKDLLAHLAKPIEAFQTPLGHFWGLDDEAGIDVKKGGLFPIVHGVRILSLEHGIKQTNTIERIKALNAHNLWDETFAKELVMAFDTLLALRLKGQLHGLEDARIDTTQLEKIERDLLKEALKVVRRFKKFLVFHYHLEMVS